MISDSSAGKNPHAKYCSRENNSFVEMRIIFSEFKPADTALTDRLFFSESRLI